MKILYMIGGTMGAGKTTVCQSLKNKLNNSVFLDGDWCWDMNPFRVTDETKDMVLDNICHTLNNFLHCSEFEHIIFCWVMHEQSIIDSIKKRLELNGCKTAEFSLICSEEVLKKRLRADVERGIRTEDVIGRSAARIPLYEKLDTVKIDVSEITADIAAEQIIDAAEK